MSNIHPMRPQYEPRSTTGQPANENASGPDGRSATAPVYSDWLQNGNDKAPGGKPTADADRKSGVASYAGYAALAATIALLAYILGGPVMDLVGPVTVTGQD